MDQSKHVGPDWEQSFEWHLQSVLTAIGIGLAQNCLLGLCPHRPLVGCADEWGMTGLESDIIG